MVLRCWSNHNWTILYTSVNKVWNILNLSMFDHCQMLSKNIRLNYFRNVKAHVDECFWTATKDHLLSIYWPNYKTLRDKLMKLLARWDLNIFISLVWRWFFFFKAQRSITIPDSNTDPCVQCIVLAIRPETKAVSLCIFSVVSLHVHK